MSGAIPDVRGQESIEAARAWPFKFPGERGEIGKFFDTFPLYVDIRAPGQIAMHHHESTAIPFQEWMTVSQ